MDMESAIPTTSCLNQNNSSVSVNRYKMDTNIYANSMTDIKTSLFIIGLKMSNFGKDNKINTTVTVVDNKILFFFEYPNTSTLFYIDLELYIHKQLQLTTNTQYSGFFGYHFQTFYYNFGINSNNIAYNYIKWNTNETSTAYLIGGMRIGKIKRQNKIAVVVGTQNATTQTYNATFIIDRFSTQDNIISVYVYNTSLSDPGQFTGIWFYKQFCSDPSYPHLLLKQQRCYDVCPSKYYNNSQKKCNKCDQCTNINRCTYCHYTMCDTDQYYIHSNKTCKQCTTLHPHCQKCYDKKCILCTFASGLVANNGTCVPCVIGESYTNTHTGRCQSCFGEYKCTNCTGDQYFCTLCTYPYKMTSNNTCLDCYYPYVLDENILDCVLITYGFELSVDKGRQNERMYDVEIVFGGNVSLVIQNYNIQFKVDGVIVNYNSLEIIGVSNTIRAQISIPISFGVYNVLSVQFVLLNEHMDVLIKYKAQQNIFIHIQQQDQSSEFHPEQQLQPQQEQQPQQQQQPQPLQAGNNQILESIMVAGAQHSGAILTTFSLTSLSGYIIGILWNFQIASYYLFLEVKKPQKLLQYLNTTIEMQNIQILPFSISSPYSDQTIIKGQRKYQIYNIDLYFLRSNFEDIMSLLIFCVFYALLYLFFQKFKPKNFMTKLIKNKLVHQFYKNISMNFYSIITVIAFTGAAALSSHQSDSKQELYNEMSAAFGLFIAFVFTVLHPIVLARYKNSQDWDTEQCYVGLNKERRYSELVLSIFLISQMIIPVVIPLLHPMASITFIILSSLINLVFLIKIRTVKFGICIYYRIISQICFIIFNLLFAVCFVVQQYLPGVDIAKLDGLGYLIIVSMGIVIGLEFVELVTEIVMDSVRFFKRILLRTKISQLRHSQQTQKKKIKEIQSNSVITNKIINKKKIRKYQTEKMIETQKQSQIKLKSQLQQFREHTNKQNTESTLKTRKRKRKSNKIDYPINQQIENNFQENNSEAPLQLERSRRKAKSQY